MEVLYEMEINNNLVSLSLSLPLFLNLSYKKKYGYTQPLQNQYHMEVRKQKEFPREKKLAVFYNRTVTSKTCFQIISPEN